MELRTRCRVLGASCFCRNCPCIAGRFSSRSRARSCVIGALHDEAKAISFNADKASLPFFSSRRLCYSTLAVSVDRGCWLTKNSKLDPGCVSAQAKRKRSCVPKFRCPLQRTSGELLKLTECRPQYGVPICPDCGFYARRHQVIRIHLPFFLSVSLSMCSNIPFVRPSRMFETSGPCQRRPRIHSSARTLRGGNARAIAGKAAEGTGHPSSRCLFVYDEIRTRSFIQPAS